MFSFKEGNVVHYGNCIVLIDFPLTVKAATLIFIAGCASAISPTKEGKSCFIYNSEMS